MFGELGDFWIFRYPPCNLLDKKWAIRRFLGNWKIFGELEIQNPNPHWKLDFVKFTGLRR
jgi:hypothetical protein